VIEAEFGDRFAVEQSLDAVESTEPRLGAFEVTLERADGSTELVWSKLQLGEPANVEAAWTVGEAVCSELK